MVSSKQKRRKQPSVDRGVLSSALAIARDSPSIVNASSDEAEEVPGPKKQKTQTSRNRRGVLSGLSLNQIPLSTQRPVEHPESEDDDDDGEDNHEIKSTRPAAPIKDHGTRESRYGRAAANYDQKYHPMDEVTRPKRAANRQSGSRSVLLKRVMSPEITSETLPSGESSESDSDGDGAENDDEDEDDNEDSRLSMAVSPPMQREPDPKASRHPARASAQKAINDDKRVHPRDFSVAGIKAKARRNKATPLTSAPKTMQPALPIVLASTKASRKRERDTERDSTPLVPRKKVKSMRSRSPATAKTAVQRKSRKVLKRSRQCVLDHEPVGSTHDADPLDHESVERIRDANSDEINNALSFVEFPDPTDSDEEDPSGDLDQVVSMSLNGATEDSRASANDRDQPVQLPILIITRPYLDTTLPQPSPAQGDLRAQAPTLVQPYLDTTLPGLSPKQNNSKPSLDQFIPEPLLGPSDSQPLIDPSISKSGQRTSSIATTSSSTLQYARQTPARNASFRPIDSATNVPQEWAFADAFAVTDRSEESSDASDNANNPERHDRYDALLQMIQVDANSTSQVPSPSPIDGLTSEL